MSGREPVFLIDGSSYIYRAYHAVKGLKTSQGIPTNAVYGFTQMLQKVLKDLNPVYLAVVLDARGPTFRHEAYEHYKANRPEMPEDLRVQMEWIRRILSALRIPQLEKEGFEADDIIGTLSRLLAERGLRVIIISGDKDLFQLVNDRVVVLDTLHDRLFDRKKVLERYGVEPERLPDVFGLMGDASDNIPGVPGIGEKRAKELICRFGSLEEAIRRAEEIPQRSVREALLAHADQARLSKRLATIDTEVNIEWSLEDLRFGPPDWPRLRQLYRDLEFHRLLQEAAQEESPCRKSRYRTLRSHEEISQYLSDIGESQRIFLEALASGGDPMRSELLGIALAASPRDAAFIPLSRESGTETLELLRPLLEDPKRKKCGHDLKRTWVLLRRKGVVLQGLDADVMVASYLLNPSKRAYDLESLSLEFLDMGLGPKEGKGKATLEKGAWACRRVEAASLLVQRILPRLKESGLERLFYELEMPLIPVLARMELQGVKVDIARLEKLSREFSQRLRQLQQEIFSLAGEEFNLNSPQQLGRILFQKLKLPVIRRTKTGFSTDMEVLRELAKGHEVPGKILEYRSLAKLKSTYVDSLPRLVNPETGRIHTFFNQTVTATGRLSSSEPNLQNIPVRNETGQAIRAAFIPEKGFEFLSADYSQVELRILAHLSKDPILLDAFSRDEDVHTRTAAEIFGVSPDEVTPQMRREAKTINFGIIYGMSAYGLARELDVEPKVARAYIEGYFQRYKAVQTFINEVLEGARERGYVETLMKRRRYLPEIRSSNATTRKFSERIAINTTVQGTAADLIKKAMIRIQRRMDAEGLASRMLIQVHDELLFEVAKGERHTMEALVKEEMEGVENLEVPLRVDLGWGSNWAEVH
jgi:DNA polymerase-1